MYRRTFAILISVLALAGVAAGCGSDDSDSLTKAEFVEQADPACKKANEQKVKKFQAYVKKLEGENKSLSSASEQGIVKDFVVPALEKQVKAVNELETPEDDEGELDEIRTRLDKLLNEAKQGSNTSEVSATPYAELEKMARAYGFKYCGYA